MNIAIIGKNIGKFIFELLIKNNNLTLYDNKSGLVSNGTGLFIKVEPIDLDNDVKFLIENNDIIISTYPTYVNKRIVEFIGKYDNKCFIDVFGNNRIINYCKYISEKSSSTLIPVGGLFGICNIICNELVKNFDIIKNIEIKCGVLPKYEKNISRCSLPLYEELDQYLETCNIIHNMKKYEVPALSGYETINLDGISYEAFNVSSPLISYNTENYSYKIIKYPGTYNKLKCLIEDFNLISRPNLLFDVFSGLLVDSNDKTIIICEISGNHKKMYTKTFETGVYDGIIMTSYQALISYSICSLVNLYINEKISGFVSIDKISYLDFISNRYGGILKL